MRDNTFILNQFLNNQHLFRNGLCTWVNDLRIRDILTNEEAKDIILLIKNNKPIYSKIFRFNSLFYWKPCDIEPRLKFLIKHLK